MSRQIYVGILFFLVGNVVAWFQFNGQFVWESWKDKPVLTTTLLGPVMGMCFWYAVKNIVEHTNELWSSKLIGFGVSNFVFAIMTYALLRESILTAKTMSCLFLAAIIIAIQIFWK